ncbi:MAG: alpha/beta hydrolase-fold protein, partial [Bacteroidota bacterium]
AARRLAPSLVLGVCAGDRLQEYGTAEPTDYLNRGAKAKAYTHFMINELLPHLYAHYPCQKTAKAHTLAGFSLGGLSALDIVWHHPQHFAQVGVFSGSLWWRSKPFDPADPDADRIMHAIIAEGPQRADLRFWLQTGTADETSDRNNNGIIDAIDDTLDLIKALEQVGYQKNQNIHYLEVEGGTHTPQTWGAVMDRFLTWI